MDKDRDIEEQYLKLRASRSAGEESSPADTDEDLYMKDIKDLAKKLARHRYEMSSGTKRTDIDESQQAEDLHALEESIFNELVNAEAGSTQIYDRISPEEAAASPDGPDIGVNMKAPDLPAAEDSSGGERPLELEDILPESELEKMKQEKGNDPTKAAAAQAVKKAGSAQKKKQKGKRKKKKKQGSLLKRVLLTLLKIGIACVLLVCAYIGFTIATAPRIDPANIYDAMQQSSILYDDAGNEFDSVNYGEDRTLIGYNEIPDATVHAFIALEDKTFFQHHGFNWIRMFGAVFSALTGHGQISGTSTITQQLARNVYLPEIKSERSIRRKIIEMYYASRIEHTLSKEDIFAAYLNSIYFGYGNYGIEAAANMYFSKNTSELNLVESAALAALPQSPDSYSLLKDVTSDTINDEGATQILIDDKPYICNDISKDRRDLCLELMQVQGYITEEELRQNEGTDLVDFINPSFDEQEDLKASYFTDYTVEQVISDLMNTYNLSYENAASMVYSGGLQIYTTLDSEAQKVVEDEFNTNSNFPTLSYFRQDEDGNMITDSGAISLYAYGNMFDEDNNFIMKADEFKANSDGSVTVRAGHRLNLYETETASGTDYSVEFKPCYGVKDSEFYIFPGGYINIPLTEKTLSNGEDVTISAEFLQSNPESYQLTDDSLIIRPSAYTLQEGVIQPQGAMVITEVGTGQIKAMIGGRGITGSRTFNRATGTRQPGSSIKPLAIYSAALQLSYDYAENGDKFPYVDFHNDKQGTKYYGDYLTAASTIVDEPIKMEGKIWPKNAYNGYMGKVSMRKALQQSINVVAVKLYNQIGGDYSFELVRRFGITSLVDDDKNPAALALGGLSNGVSPLEMALAYASFPNGGVRNSGVCYTKVVDAKGKTILESKSEETRVIDPGVAWIMTDMLKSVVTSGLGRNASISGVQSGGKTGTTTSNYDIWFDGFTPHYAAALWIGTDYNIELNASSTLTAWLWGRIMNQIPEAKTGTYREMPSNVIRTKGEYFTRGTETGLYLKKDDDKDKDKDKEDDQDEEEKQEQKEQTVVPQTPDDNTDDKPGTDKPGTDTPGTDTPGTDKPGTDTPGTDTPGTDTPGTDKPGTDTPGTDTPIDDTGGTGTGTGTGNGSGTGEEPPVIENPA